jgi:hypothetical protein
LGLREVVSLPAAAYAVAPLPLQPVVVLVDHLIELVGAVVAERIPESISA